MTYCPPLEHLLDPKIENNWIVIVPAILHSGLYLEDEILKGEKVLSYVIQGVYLNDIPATNYIDTENKSIIPRVSFVFLYSFARCALRSSYVDQNTLVLAEFIKNLIENCLKVDDSKAFEKFNALYLLLILQLRSFLCKPLNPLSMTKFLIQFTQKKTLTVKELLLNKITIDDNHKSLLDLEIKLLDDNGIPVIYKFDEDKDRPYDDKETNKQPGRSLEKRFSKDEIKFNTFYLSSQSTEAGIEGAILLPLSNGDSLLISLQTKLKLENTLGYSYITGIDRVLEASNKLKSFFSNKDTKIHVLPILITNRDISKNEINTEGVVIIHDKDLENFLGYSFSTFPFRNSFL